MSNANNDFELNKDNWKDYQKDLANAYFPKEEDAPKLTGISIKNDISRTFEDKTIVGNYLKNGITNETVVAWKAGRLVEAKDDIKYIPQTSKEKNYLNGYGKPIKKEELDKYLKFVNEEYKKIENKSDFSCVYNSLVSEKNVPRNFGSVYIINLIYFKSKGTFPIYDKFAHKAVKALHMNKSPHEIFVGDAPGKYEVNKVVNMYQEYVWLLDEVFPEGQKQIGITGDENQEVYISRELDRALWVYGHATKGISFA